MQKKPNKTGESTDSLEVKPEKNFSENIKPKKKRGNPNLPYAKNQFPTKKKRKVSIKPSHRKVFAKFKENGYRNLRQAVRESGSFSTGVTMRTHNITNTKSWQLLMQEQMPDELLAQRHAEILDKRDYRKRTKLDDDGNPVYDEMGKEVQEEVDDGPNASAVVKGLDMAYKLKGAYTKEEAPAASTVMYNLFYKPEVREQMKTFEDGLKQSLFNEMAKKNQKDTEEEQQQVIHDAETTVESAGEDSGTGEGDSEPVRTD
jgi:hypothetical protein